MRWPCGPSPTPLTIWRGCSVCRPIAGRWGSSPPPRDDALFTALDQGTKASPADVVYAKIVLRRAPRYPSGPLSGECIGIYAARDPAEIDAALDACLAYLENEAWFYGVRAGRGPRRRWRSIPHVIASVGRYLAPLANVRVGSPLAYLIAPPLESVVGLDAACKAGRVRVAKWFGPPSETNFGGAYLAGDLPACEAAARAFAAAIVDVCGRAAPRGDPRAVVRGPCGCGAPRSLRRPSTESTARSTTGERFAEKPDHLTHLRDDASLVPKTHPRIVARGKLDLLQSAAARRAGRRRRRRARGPWSASWARSSSSRARWSAPR